MHQASTGVVLALQRQGIEVRVLGQNKGWKNASELGRQFNRRSHRVGHAQLLEQLRYKCEAARTKKCHSSVSYCGIE